jgi:hypothetical protein
MKHYAKANYLALLHTASIAALRASKSCFTLLAMLLFLSSAAKETHGQVLRVSSYNYESENPGTFHTFTSVAYVFGVGQTNISWTNVTVGLLENPNIVGHYRTNSCGWDTNAGSLSTERQVNRSKLTDEDAVVNSESFTESWTGGGPDFPSGYPAISIPWLKESVGLEYLTGGDTNNPQSQVYEITVFDTRENGQPFPASEASVDGVACDSEGRVYKTWTGCTTNGVSVSFSTNRTNVYYKVSVGMVRPQIFFVRSTFELDGNGVATTNVFTTTNLVTDATNTVMAGEKITLVCKMATDSGTVVANPTISAWSWTIGGKTLSNYVGTSNLGKDYEPFDKDKEECTFHWKAGTNGAEVKCNATVNGATVPAKAYFDVTKPDPSFSVVLDPNAIAIDGNHGALDEGEVGLHWGTGFVGEAAGITYNYTPVTNQWSICQLATSITRKNFRPATIKTVFGSGLDGAFPTDLPSDSPLDTVGANDDEVWANDEFRVWLMYKPPTPGAIWVPIRKVSEKFGWDAKAVKAPNGTWSLTLAKTLPENTTLLESEETDGYPTWNKNVPNDLQTITVPR